MKIELVHTGYIAEHWPCEIEYGEGELTKREQLQLDSWLFSLPVNYILEYGETSELAVDEITGLHASCVEVKVYEVVER